MRLLGRASERHALEGWFISLNVDGTLVTLAHDTPRADGPDGPGMYASVDDVAERATSFPHVDRLKASLKTDGARTSRDCVAAAATKTTMAAPTTTAPTTTTTTRPPTTKPTVASTGVYYANCTEAKAQGAAPLYRGQPGYRLALDRDDDGIACET